MKLRLKNNNFVGKELAGSTGLEPAVSALTGRRVSQLHHDPNLGYSNIFSNL